MANLLIGVILPALLLLVAILIVGFVIARMYKRATREVSLVKTGAGGLKVIMDGGTLVVPVLHQITPVNMRTVKIEVRRTNTDALITKDRQRADVAVEFYVAVNPDEDGIAQAAQTLGNKTFDEAKLRDMIEGKLVDGLRSVAAKMDLDDLHENRADFVQQVQQTVTEDLKKNGLVLEGASLTALDQTPVEGLDENNIFNSQGMRVMAQRVAENRKRKAEIEADAEVSVAQSKQAAAIKTYEIETEQESARVDQAIKKQQLAAKEATEKSRNEQEAERAAEEAEIQRKKAIELAEQDRAIAVAGKSEEESKARAKADTARAEAIKATASIETAQKVAEGERAKRLAILAAEQEAETSATSVRVEAKAARDAAADRAVAIRELAQAEADKITIEAEANKTSMLAEAEGKRALIEADNSLSDKILEYRTSSARLEALPKIIAEMVKPAEKITGISINQIGGLAGGTGATIDGIPAAANDGNLVNQAFDQIGKMAIKLPALTALGKSVGLNLETGLAGILDGAYSDDANRAAIAKALPTLAPEAPASEQDTAA